jgi:hypothetical protein
MKTVYKTRRFYRRRANARQRKEERAKTGELTTRRDSLRSYNVARLAEELRRDETR